MRCIAFSQVAQEKSVSYEPACLSLCPQNANHFAVGDGSNSGMAVYIYDAGTLEEIKKLGMTTVIVEQNAIAALHLADRAIILDMGQVVFDGTAQEVLDNADLRQEYLAI